MTVDIIIGKHKKTFHVTSGSDQPAYVHGLAWKNIFRLEEYLVSDCKRDNSFRIFFYPIQKGAIIKGKNGSKFFPLRIAPLLQVVHLYHGT